MYDILVTALQTLAGVCDGAIKDDRMGFNGRDTRFGHELAELSLKRKLSDGQQTAAIKMLQIYRTQLKSYGIELPTITEYAQITTALPRRELQPRVTKVTVSASQYAFIVSFPYNAALVAAIKTLPRRKWDNPTKSWLVPADCYDELVAVLEGREVEWDVEARSLVDRTGRARIASTAQEAEIDVPNLTGALLPFQKAGVRFVDIAGGRALIGDEMGLGKTVQALGWFAKSDEIDTAIVICPASLKSNWRKEALKWLAGIGIITIELSGKPSTEFARCLQRLLPLYHQAWLNHRQKNKNIQGGSQSPFIAGLCHALSVAGTGTQGAINHSSALESLNKPLAHSAVSVVDKDLPPATNMERDVAFTIDDAGSIAESHSARDDNRNRLVFLSNQEPVPTQRAADTVGIYSEIACYINQQFPSERSALRFIDLLLGQTKTASLTRDAIAIHRVSQSGGIQTHDAPSGLQTMPLIDEATRFLSLLDSEGSTFRHKLLLIVNYDVLDGWKETLESLNVPLIIADEFHYCKSRTSQRTKAVKELSEHSPYFLGLSGTPLLNRPIELFPLLNILRPTEWNNYMAFAKRYCAAKQRTVGGKNMPKRTIWDVSGASNLSELHNKLRTLMVRRLKSIVMQELPDKRRVIVPMEIDLADYDTFIERTTDELERAGNRAAQMVIIEKARQYVLEQKINHCAAWIGDFLQSGEKLLVFTWHKATAAVLKELFPHAVAITGESSQAEREHAVEAFQKDEKVKLFIGNIAAAGVGLTLTAASNVAFVEMGWRPGDQTQAEDRTHRYGQKNAVTAYYLLAEQTIEEDMYKLLEKKRVVTETVTDGAASDFGFNTNHVAHDLIDLLLEKKKDKKK